MVELRNHLEIFQELNATIYPVSVDTPAQSRLLSKEYELPFNFLCDTERSAIAQYGVFHSHRRGGIAYPATFIINPEGVIIFRSLDRKAFRIDVKELIAFLKSLEEEPAHIKEGGSQGYMIPVVKQYLRDKGLLPNPYED